MDGKNRQAHGQTLSLSLSLSRTQPFEFEIVAGAHEAPPAAAFQRFPRPIPGTAHRRSHSVSGRVTVYSIEEEGGPLGQVGSYDGRQDLWLPLAPALSVCYSCHAS